MVYVYDSTVHCLKQTEEILPYETSPVFLVDLNGRLHLALTCAAPVQVLLGNQIEEEPPAVVYVYDSTIDCLKQTEEILQNETSFGFLVDPDSSVEQSMQELMQDLCTGPSENA